MDFVNDTIEEEDEDKELGRLSPNPYESPGPGPSNDVQFATVQTCDEAYEALGNKNDPSNISGMRLNVVMPTDSILMELFEKHPSVLKELDGNKIIDSDENSSVIYADVNQSVMVEPMTNSESEIVDNINNYMDHFKTIEEKLTAICHKYLGAITEKRRLETENYRTARQMYMLRCQKEHLLTKYDRVVRVRDRMKIVCQSLQLQIKSLKDETVIKLSEEHEKCMGLIASIKKETPDVKEQTLKLNQLEEANGELTAKCRMLSENNEAQRSQMGKMEMRIRLESQLNMTKRKKMKLEADTEREQILNENQRLFKDLNTAEMKLKDLSDKFNGTMKVIENHDGYIFQINHLRDENTKLRMKVSRIETDAMSWNTLWSKSQKTLVEMTEKRRKERDEAVRREEHLEMVQNVCRSLQAERFRLLDKIRRLSMDEESVSREHDDMRVVTNEKFTSPFNMKSESVYEANTIGGCDSYFNNNDRGYLTRDDRNPAVNNNSPQNIPEKCLDTDQMPTWSKYEKVRKEVFKNKGNIDEGFSKCLPPDKSKIEPNVNNLSKSVERLMKTLVSNGFSFDKPPFKTDAKSVETFSVYRVVDVDIPPPLSKKFPTLNVRKNSAWNVKEKRSCHKNRSGRSGDMKANTSVGIITYKKLKEHIPQHMKCLSVCAVNNFDIPPAVKCGVKVGRSVGDGNTSHMNSVMKVMRVAIDPTDKSSVVTNHGISKEQTIHWQEDTTRKMTNEPVKVFAKIVKSVETSSNKGDMKNTEKLASQSEISAINKARITDVKNPKNQLFTQTATTDFNMVSNNKDVTTTNSKISVKALVNNFNNINKMPGKPSFRTLVDRNDIYSENSSESKVNSAMCLGSCNTSEISDSEHNDSDKVLSKILDTPDQVGESKSLKELASLVQSLFKFSKQLRMEGQTMQNAFQMGAFSKEYDIIRNISSATFQEMKKEANNIAQVLRLDEIRNERPSISDNPQIRLDREINDGISEIECVQNKVIKEKRNVFPIILDRNNLLNYPVSRVSKEHVQWLRIEHFVNSYDFDEKTTWDIPRQEVQPVSFSENSFMEKNYFEHDEALSDFSEARDGAYQIGFTVGSRSPNTVLKEPGSIFHGDMSRIVNVEMGPVNMEKSFDRNFCVNKLFTIKMEECFGCMHNVHTRITKGQIEWLPIETYTRFPGENQNNMKNMLMKSVPSDHKVFENVSNNQKPFKSENLFFIKHLNGEQLDSVSRKKSTHKEWILIEKPLSFEESDKRVQVLKPGSNLIASGQIEWLSVEENSTGIVARRNPIDDSNKIQDEHSREWFVVNRTSKEEELDETIAKISSRMAVGHIKWLPIKDSLGCLDGFQEFCSNLDIGLRRWCLLQRTVTEEYYEGNTTCVDEQQWFLYDKTLVGNRKSCAVGQVEWHSLKNNISSNSFDPPVDYLVHARYQDVIREMLQKHSDRKLNRVRENVKQPLELRSVYEKQGKPVALIYHKNNNEETERKLTYKPTNQILYPDQGLGVKDKNQIKEGRELSPVTYYLQPNAGARKTVSRQTLTGMHGENRGEIDRHGKQIGERKDRVTSLSFSTTKRQGRVSTVTSECKSRKKESQPKSMKKLSAFMQKLF